MSLDLSKLAVPFPEEDIEWRIGRAHKKANGQITASCLAYVQARAIMNRLDDVCGPGNWKAAYRTMSGHDGMSSGIICELSIHIDGQWVTKEDGAEQTDIESFKGGISSALKRAGSVWGIGRYLYKLESTWATITNDSKGSNWGKTKEGAEFYWLPPPLPAWALPDPSQARPRWSIHTEQPPASVGVSPDHGYRIPFGKYARRSLEEIDLGDLRSYVGYIEDKAAKDGKPLSGNVLDFIQRASAHLAALEDTSAIIGGSGQ